MPLSYAPEDVCLVSVGLKFCYLSRSLVALSGILVLFSSWRSLVKPSVRSLWLALSYLVEHSCSQHSQLLRACARPINTRY